MNTITKKILLVEDEEVLRNALFKRLENEHFSVFQSKNGEEGLKVALDEKPDLILLDIGLPDLNGMEVMEKIRQNSDWGKVVPIIILTNFNTNNSIIESVVKDNPAYYMVKAESTLDLVIEKVKSCL